MSDPVRGIVVAHGGMAAALVEAARRITGVENALVAISNEGLGAEGLRAKVGAACDPGPAVLFIDLAAGSCAMAGLGVRRLANDVAVITGVNLPMLVDFAFNRELPIDDLVDRLVEKGRSAVSGHDCRDGESGSGSPPDSPSSD